MRRSLSTMVKAGTLVVLLYPVIWIVAASLKPGSEALSSVSLRPSELTWSNYSTGWTGVAGASFGQFFVNSLVVAAGSLAGNVVSCLLAAFAFTYLRFPLRRLWYAAVICTLLLPQHVLLIQQYMLFRELGWLNTPLPLIVPKILATDSFFVLLMVQFLRILSERYDESARMDGAGPFQLFWHVILPLSRPALVATAILSFVWAWNDFFPQLVYLPLVEDSTVPSGLHQYAIAEGLAAPGPMFAMCVLAIVPMLVVFVAFQRLLISSVAPGRMYADLPIQLSSARRPR